MQVRMEYKIMQAGGYGIIIMEDQIKPFRELRQARR